MLVTKFVALVDIRTAHATGFGWSAGVNYTVHAPKGSIITVEHAFWRVRGEKVRKIKIQWPKIGGFDSDQPQAEVLGRLIAEGAIQQITDQ